MARQKEDESLQEFADRCGSLAHKTVPQVDDPVLQKHHYEHAERMLLASFPAGLVGTPGRQVRFSLPKNMQEALRIAVTFQQAELQERRNETFYVDEVKECGKADRPSRGTRRNASMRNTAQQAGTGRTQDQSNKGSFRNTGIVNNRKCYECGDVGNFACECPTHQNRRDTRNRTSTRGGNASQVPAGTPSLEATRQPKGRRNDTAVSKRARNGSGDSCFHTTAPKNEANYFTVRVELISGTPTIQAIISCFYRLFIVDTGSSISLIQPRVYSSDVSSTNLSHFGVTGKQKYKGHKK